MNQNHRSSHALDHSRLFARPVRGHLHCTSEGVVLAIDFFIACWAAVGEFTVPVRFRWPLFGKIMSAMIEPGLTVTFALFEMATVWPTKYMMPEKFIVPLENVSVEPLLVDG